jgi:serine O-acetyltransferase
MPMPNHPSVTPPLDQLALADRLLALPAQADGRRAPPSRLPSAGEIGALAEDLLAVLFPEVGRTGAPGGTDLRQSVAAALAILEPHLEMAVFSGIHRGCRSDVDACRERSRTIAAHTMQSLPEIRALLLQDVQAAADGDPAASGPDEIIACYPGLYAIAVYRVAHRLLGEGSEILPRMLTEHAKSRTGIDIHPGATIGSSFFIDHGTGIVIGETTQIGNFVRIYQGVTLGALSIKRRDPGGDHVRVKRHPTIEDEVVIYANATILGGNTVIGRGAVIGGNTFITYSVPPGIRVGLG